MTGMFTRRENVERMQRFLDDEHRYAAQADTCQRKGDDDSAQHWRFEAQEAADAAREIQSWLDDMQRAEG